MHADSRSRFFARYVPTILWILLTALLPSVSTAQDVTPPGIESFAPTPSATIDGNSVTFAANFTEAIQGLSSDDMNIRTTGDLSFGDVIVSSTADPSKWLVLIRGLGGSGDIDCQIIFFGVQDLAGNFNETDFVSSIATRPASAGLNDTTPPEILYIEARSAAGEVIQTPTWIVQFDEGVTDFDDSTDIGTSILEGGGLFGRNIFELSASRYQVSLSFATGEALVAMFVRGGAVENEAGLRNVGNVDADFPLRGDATKPGATAVVEVPSTPTNLSNIPYLITFDDQVFGFGSDPARSVDIITNGITTSPDVTIEEVSSVFDETVFRVTVHSVVGVGTLGLVIPAFAANNGAGLFNDEIVLPTVDVSVADIPPFVVSGESVGAPPFQGGDVAFRIVFNEPIVNFSAADLSTNITGSVVFDSIDVTLSGDRTEATAIARATDGEGTLGLTVNAGLYQDDAGNPSEVPFTIDPVAIVVDGTDPFTVSLEPVNDPPFLAGDLEFLIRFSEPIVGLEAFELRPNTTGTVSTGTVSFLMSGDRTEATITIADVAGVGTLLLRVDDGAYQDDAGNENNDGFSGDPVNIVAEITRPFVASITPVGTPPFEAGDVGFTVNFNEPVVDFDSTDVTIQRTGTVFNSNLNVNVNPSRTSALVTVVGVGGIGSVGITVLDGGYRDDEGAASDTPFVGNPVSIVLDATPPFVNFVTVVGTPPFEAGPVSFDIGFSEAVQNFASADLTLNTTGSVTTGAIDLSINPDRRGARATISNVAGIGSLGITIDAGAYNDDAGVVAVDSFVGTPVAMVLDATPPTVVSVVPVEPTPFDLGDAQFTVSFSERVVDFTGADVSGNRTGSVAFNGISAALSGDRLSALVTVEGVSGIGTLGITVNAGGYSDDNGNASTAQFVATPVQVVLDQTPPSVISANPDQVGPVPGGPVSFTITFSEGINNLDVADIVPNTTGSVVPGSFTVTPTPERVIWNVAFSNVGGAGTLSLTVLAGGYVDFFDIPSEVPFTGNAIEIETSILTVGVLEFDPSPGGSIVSTSATDADITAPVLINGFLLLETNAQIRGGIVTGNGTISTEGNSFPLNATSLTGNFRIDASNGNLTASSGNVTSTLGNIQGILCRAIIGASSMTVDFRSPESSLANTAFRNVQVGSGGINYDDAQFYTTGSDCGQPGVGSLVYEIGAASVTTQRTVLGNLTSPISTLSTLVLNRIGTPEITGNATASGLTFNFTSATFTSIAIRPGSPEVNLDGSTVTFNNLTIPRNGNATASGGTIRAGSMDSTFSEASFSSSSVFIGTVTMAPGGGLSPATADNFVLTTLPNADPISSDGGTLTIRGVRFPFPSAKFVGGFGFSAEDASLQNSSLFTFKFNQIGLTSSGISTSGAGFDLVGLRFNISIGSPATGSQGIVFGGELGLPDNLSGASLSGNVTVIGSNVQLNSLSFCTPSIGVEVKKSAFDLPQLCFSFDNGPPRILEADASVSIPAIFTLEAGFAIFNGFLDRISIAVRNLNKAIGNTGAFLQDIAVSVRNLSRQSKTFTVTERVFRNGQPPVERRIRRRGVPPVQFVGDIGATAGPSILGKALLRTDARVLLDETQMNLDGSATVIIFKTGGAYVHIMWAGPKKGTAFGGFMVYLSVLRGNIDAFIGFNGRVSACAGLSLQVPRQIPLIGGLKLGSTSICLGAPPFRLTGSARITIVPGFCTPKILFIPKVCFPPRTLKVGFKVDERGRFSVNRKARGERFAEWEIPYFQGYPVDLPSTESNRPIAGGEPQESNGEMVFFTNFYQDDKAYSSEGAFRRDKGTTESIDHVLDGTRPAIIRLAYEDENGIPDFNLTTPSGTVYTPAHTLGAIPEFPNPDEMDLEAAYSSTPESRNAAYFIPEPEPGIYTLTILQPGTLGQFGTEVLLQNSPPTFSFNDIVFDTDSLLLDWDDEDIDDNATVRIFLDTDKQDANGLQISEEIPEDDETDSLVIDLVTTPLSAGWYWPYATIDDENNEPTIVYADEPIFVPDVEAPPTIVNIQAVSTSSTVLITWDPVDDPEVVSYKILWTTNPESNIFNTGASVDAGETVAIIEGLEDATRYKFTIVPMKFSVPDPARRAAKLQILSNAARAARSASAPNTNNRQTRANRASTQVYEALGRNKAVLLSDAESRSLAQQTAELNSPLSRRQYERAARNPRIAALMQQRAAAFSTRSIPKGTAEPDYTDGFSAAADTLLLSTGFGNEPPFFITQPEEVTVEGDLYTFQAEVSDADGDAVTFTKLEGPSALTVSPTGFVSWQTEVGDGELHDIAILATDERGESTTLSWRVMVATVRPIATLRFVIPRSVQVVPEETWTYLPKVEGLFLFDDPDDVDDITYDLIDGPIGMTIDTFTGELNWDTTLDDLGNHRVILRVRQDLGPDYTQEAVQELQVNVEDTDDTLLDLELDIDFKRSIWTFR